MGTELRAALSSPSPADPRNSSGCMFSYSPFKWRSVISTPHFWSGFCPLHVPVESSCGVPALLRLSWGLLRRPPSIPARFTRDTKTQAWHVSKRGRKSGNPEAPVGTVTPSSPTPALRRSHQKGAAEEIKIFLRMPAGSSTVSTVEYSRFRPAQASSTSKSERTACGTSALFRML